MEGKIDALLADFTRRDGIDYRDAPAILESLRDMYRSTSDARDRDLLCATARQVKAQAEQSEYEARCDDRRAWMFEH